MATTLYKTSENARKVVIVILFVVIAYLTIDAISRFKAAAPLQGVTTPSFYMKADKALGDIATYQIPGISIDKSVNPTYSLEGIEIGVFPDTGYVYQIEKPREKLLVLENAQKSVTAFGFDPNSYTQDENGLYIWKTAQNTRTVTFDKINQIWKLTTDYTNNINAKTKKTLDGSIKTYQSAGQNVASRAGFNVNGLDSSSTPLIDVKYVKLDNGQFFNKENYLEADYVIVNMYRTLRFSDLKPKDQQPTTTATTIVPKALNANVYTSDPRVGSLKIIGTNRMTDLTKDIYELYYKNWSYTDVKGAYAIITSAEAWTKIQTGQGVLTSLTSQNTDYFADYPQNVKVRSFTADRGKTQIAYWEPEEWKGFAYPIYIFQGHAEMQDGTLANFTYYVDAIKRVQ